MVHERLCAVASDGLLAPSQPLGDDARVAEMILNGAYLVAATFAVNHSSILKAPVYANAQKLRDSERQLAGFDENSFQPPLSRLKAVIRSMAAAH